jgi:hypothetical protein
MSPETKADLEELEAGLYRLSSVSEVPSTLTQADEEYHERRQALESGNPFRYLKVCLQQLRRPPIQE